MALACTARAWQKKKLPNALTALNQSASLCLPAVSSFTDGPSWQQTHTDKCQFSEYQNLYLNLCRYPSSIRRATAVYMVSVSPLALPGRGKSKSCHVCEPPSLWWAPLWSAHACLSCVCASFPSSLRLRCIFDKVSATVCVWHLYIFLMPARPLLALSSKNASALGNSCIRHSSF